MDRQERDCNNWCHLDHCRDREAERRRPISIARKQPDSKGVEKEKKRRHLSKHQLLEKRAIRKKPNHKNYCQPDINVPSRKPDNSRDRSKGEKDCETVPESERHRKGEVRERFEENGKKRRIDKGDCPGEAIMMHHFLPTARCLRWISPPVRKVRLIIEPSGRMLRSKMPRNIVRGKIDAPTDHG